MILTQADDKLGKTRAAFRADNGHAHGDLDHSKGFRTWSYETDRPLSLERLREAASKLPSGIYRAKGAIYAAEEPARRAVLQVVGKRVNMSLEGAWNGRLPRTQIVAIRAPGAIDDQEWRNKFDQCLSHGLEQMVNDRVRQQV